jgi:hypothetical protein
MSAARRATSPPGMSTVVDPGRESSNIGIGGQTLKYNEYMCTHSLSSSLFFNTVVDFSVARSLIRLSTYPVC